MAKNSFQDIRINRKRRPEPATSESVVVEKKPTPKHPFKWSSITSHSKNMKTIKRPASLGGGSGGGGSSRRWMLWSAILLVVVLLGAFLFGIFSGATIQITPQQQRSVIEGSFTAHKSPAEEGLPFDVMVLASEKSTEVPATEERQVDRKASGSIVVYNSYNSAPQRLIKNTRFESTDGHIYRIKDSIVVPGTTVDAGKLIPGSVDAVVYADEPGEAYNIGLTDFTIPGFKGDPRYGSFYARSQTAMANGFSGVMKFPSESEVARARNQLRSELQTQLLSDAQAQKPDGYVLYPDATFIVFDDNESVSESKGDAVSLTERASMQGVIFNEQDLANFIAEQSLATFDGSDVSIPGIEELTFMMEGKEDGVGPGDTISFSLSGSVYVVWDIDADAMKEAFAGVPKKQFTTVLGGFSHIERARASVRPFWKRNFPSDVNNIRIQTLIEE